jgi:hypothetical protein
MQFLHFCKLTQKINQTACCFSKEFCENVSTNRTMGIALCYLRKSSANPGFVAKRPVTYKININIKVEFKNNELRVDPLHTYT